MKSKFRRGVGRATREMEHGPSIITRIPYRRRCRETHRCGAQRACALPLACARMTAPSFRTIEIIAFPCILVQISSFRLIIPLHIYIHIFVILFLLLRTFVRVIYNWSNKVKLVSLKFDRDGVGLNG